MCGVASSCETKVLASGRNGSENLLAESLVAIVLGEVKFCLQVS